MHMIVFQMEVNHGRVVIHLDMDCFYAQVITKILRRKVKEEKRLGAYFCCLNWNMKL